ncbi:unnamed protein product [Macrosiphum euphorbiae]|uniref:Uncharacterized protein n=1 Tax=Macrosiphum euphorbiae TaxID=13131 RepID=A0AAV0WQ42_9HEMI|nr:unnamed protein product [Macrosiphum euphorbiae]
MLPGSNQNDLAQKSTVSSGIDSNFISSNNVQPQNGDTNSVLALLLEQNRLLMNQVNEFMQQRSAPSPVSVHSIGSNSYYVMPVFLQSLPDFVDKESHAEASNWIKGINSTADLHSWPDTLSSKLYEQNLKVLLVIGTWDDIFLVGNTEQQFKDAFIGTLASIVDLTKLLIARQQRKGETITEYFHDKARMYRELKFDFESKRQIIEGIRVNCVFIY